MIENHLLASAKQVPSLNYNERPNDEVSLVVIHNISLPPKEFGMIVLNNFLPINWILVHTLTFKH
ncbi:hypothetical protein BSPWISOXPB_2065 [uncultured Gammaproteobacteria bacterium]|nr:hypothetical protein BSPWISOXPB_2065 [uncultured Gammaproteobacteria bacterium]